ncbi:MAG: hypothetical protein IJ877_02395 [Candidatus Gastranaerophilales bacterium]|nr:hypothetical protein [Candidatus Gastranaerophilales bacterium]
MKKILALTLLVLLTTGSWVSARTIYDSTGRHIIYDGTIRGQKRAAQAKIEQQQKLKAAAAAKIDYEKLLKEEEAQKPKTNFYQDSIEYKRKHNIK